MPVPQRFPGDPACWRAWLHDVPVQGRGRRSPPQPLAKEVGDRRADPGYLQHPPVCTAHLPGACGEPGPDRRPFPRNLEPAAVSDAVLRETARRLAHHHSSRGPATRDPAVPVAASVAVRLGSPGTRPVRVPRSGRSRIVVTEEPRTFNPLVQGSSPWRPTRGSLRFRGSMFTFGPRTATRPSRARTRAGVPGRFRGDVPRKCIQSLRRVGWRSPGRLNTELIT